jgi:hypothetical protein
MGSSLSSESTPLAGGDKATQTKRTYRTPDVREKDRFTAADNSAVTNTFEASVDKVHYLNLNIIFLNILKFYIFF